MHLNLFAVIKSRPGLFIAAALLAVMVIGFFGALLPKRPAQNTKVYTNAVYEPAVSVVRKPPAAPRIPIAREPLPVTGTTNVPKVLAPLSIHVELPPNTNLPPLSTYAPVGRLVQCQLVNTVDSGARDTPIIALVTDGLWHEGKLVVPAGAEVHGRAQVDTLRERIISSGAWTIVRQTGEELIVNGIALDREFNEKSRTWGITDGSPGLAGQVIRSQSMEEIKLFAATMLSGIASGLQQSQMTALGTEIPGTARNAALTGTSQVLNTYAQQILETIKKQGMFVRVPAGKQFYLYVTETIDLSNGKIGNLRVAARPPEADSRTHLPSP